MFKNLLRGVVAVVAAPITIVAGTIKATGEAVSTVAKELTADEE